MAETDAHPRPHVNYVAFPSAARESNLTIPAQLRIPAGTDEAPAVVIVHGTAGLDSRGAYHAEALNGAGIATLELDMWSPRRLHGGVGSSGRPQTVVETLPDAFGALLYLGSCPGIDPQRIGIMGFSWGGVVAMLTATRPYTEQYLDANPLRFAAHAPFYPVCWTYNKVPGHEFTDLTGAPILIQTGECDAYDKPDTCEILVRSLPKEAQSHVTVMSYPGAMHGFDRLEPTQVVMDPHSHLGQGGEVTMAGDPDAADKSRRATVDFFTRAFAAVGKKSR